VGDVGCILCGVSHEDVEHLLLHYAISAHIWDWAKSLAPIPIDTSSLATLWDSCLSEPPLHCIMGRAK
jgi:hypothetical protein